MTQQTSIHIQPAKGGSEQHNKREKNLDYVFHGLTKNNEYWEKDTQSNRLAILKELAKAKTGRKMQAQATPIREAVVVIDTHTTMQDLQDLANAFRLNFGIDCFQIAIHRDEGYSKGKKKKLNLHAHMVFDWINHETGKSYKLNRFDTQKLQTITAEVLKMKRGRSSEKEHLNAIQYKIKAEQEEIKNLNIAKAYKEEAINTAKNVSESIKGILGVSAKDKAIESLKSQLNGQISKNKETVAKAKEVFEREKTQIIEEYQGRLNRQKETLNAVQRELEKEKQRADIFASLLSGMEKATQVIIGFAKDSLHRYLNQEQAQIIDQAMGEHNTATRIAIGEELVKRAKKFLPPAFHHRLERARKFILEIAKKQYWSREQEMRKGKGLKR